MICFKSNVYICHAKDESLVWYPRTDGCTMMRNATPILEEIGRDWRNVDEIVRMVTSKFDCAANEVRDGDAAVVGELEEMVPLLVPAYVLRGYHLPFVENCKYSVDVADRLVDYAIGGAEYLPDSSPSRRRIEITFRRDNRSHVGIGAQRLYGIPDFDAPMLCILLGEFTRDGAQDSPQLVAGRHGPVVVHDVNPDSMSRSRESKSASSPMNSPFSNSLRAVSIMRLNAARLRQVSISSHVLSKSATLIITLVLRPFCVMTIGRCVRDVRAKHALRVRRYSVKGTTSSSRRGRSMILAFVRMVDSPNENADIVHYSVPKGNGVQAFRKFAEAA